MCTTPLAILWTYEPPVVNGASTSNPLVSPHTHYDYSASGNEASMTDSDGQTTSYSYDANGNQISQSLPMGQSSASFYNAYGQVDHSFDFNGNETKYAYDSQGRVHTISYYPSTNLSTADDVVTYAYTALGQTYTINDSSTGRTDTYSYDAQGNMVEDQSVQGSLTPTVNHAFDPSTGLLTRTWTADGASNVIYTYDTMGRLQTLTSGSQVTTYAYDAVGNLHSTTTINGGTTTAATDVYDNLNRLVELTNTVNSITVSQYVYTLDSRGNRIEAVETLNGATQTCNYKYDADDRLTEEKYTVSGSVTLTIDYAYDLDGNRITEIQSGSAATNPGTTTSHYNANNELTRIDNANGTYTFNYYDANGSLISTATAASLTGLQTTTATHTFNDRKQLVADTVNGNTDSYSYDASGDRISATTDGTTTEYEFDTTSPTGYDEVLAETSSTGSVRVTYAWGQQLICETQSSTTSLYEFDGHGSVRQLVNAGTHSVSDTYSYDVFGNLLSSTGSTSNVYRFASMRLDGWAGIYDDAARYYTPQTDEFISRDADYGSKNDPISLHKYLYANADPVNVVDPSGHEGLAELLTTIGEYSFRGLDAIRAAYQGVKIKQAVQLSAAAAIAALGLAFPEVEGSTLIYKIPLASLGDGWPNIEVAVERSELKPVKLQIRLGGKQDSVPWAFRFNVPVDDASAFTIQAGANINLNKILKSKLPFLAALPIDFQIGIRFNSAPLSSSGRGGNWIQDAFNKGVSVGLIVKSGFSSGNKFLDSFSSRFTLPLASLNWDSSGVHVHPLPSFLE